MEKLRPKLYGEGSVYPRGTVYWVAYYHNGRPVREPARYRDGHRVRIPDKAAALRYLRNRLGEADDENKGLQPFVGPEARRVTVGDLLDLVVQQRRKKERRDTQSFRSQMKKVREEFADLRAMALTEARLDTFVREQRDNGAANATINRKLELLRQAFNLGIEKKLIVRKPHFDMLPENNVRVGFFEHDDFLAVRGFLGDPALQDFVTWAYLTGWRKGSIEALEWATDFDMTNMLMRLRPESTKENAANWVPLEGELEDVIVRRWQARIVKREDGTTFISRFVFHRGDGKRFGDFEKAWAAACKNAGLIRIEEQPQGQTRELPSKLFHDFRRTAYRNMRRAGVDPETARSTVGHKTQSMQRRYQIVAGDEKSIALNQVQDYLKRVEAKREERHKRLLRFQAAQ